MALIDTTHTLPKRKLNDNDKNHHFISVLFLTLMNVGFEFTQTFPEGE